MKLVKNNNFPEDKVCMMAKYRVSQNSEGILIKCASLCNQGSWASSKAILGYFEILFSTIQSKKLISKLRSDPGHLVGISVARLVDSGEDALVDPEGHGGGEEGQADVADHADAGDVLEREKDHEDGAEGDSRVGRGLPEEKVGQGGRGRGQGRWGRGLLAAVVHGVWKKEFEEAR